MNRNRVDRFVRGATPAPVLLLLVLLLQPMGVSLADDFQEQVGFSSNHYFESGQSGETVDITNGNLMISVPIGPRYQLNDLSYGVTLTYNSKVWDYVQSEDSDLRKPYLKYSNLGLGWIFHAGRIFLDDPNAPYYDETQEFLDPDNYRPNPYFNATPPLPPKPLRIQYEASDGTRTVLYAKDKLDPLGDYYYSHDSTYLRARAYLIHELNDPNNPEMLIWRLWEPDGTVHIMGYQRGTGRVWPRNEDWADPANATPPAPLGYEEGAFLDHADWRYKYALWPQDEAFGWYTIRLESPRRDLAGENDCNSDAPLVLELADPSQEVEPCSYVEYFYGLDAETNPAGTHSIPQRHYNGLYGLNYIQDSLGRQIKVHLPDITFTTLSSEGQHVDAVYTLGWSEATNTEGHRDVELQRQADGTCAVVGSGASVYSRSSVSSITYPYGYTTTFEYADPDCTGVMSARVLPTGARSEYEYAVYPYKDDFAQGLSLVRRSFLVDGQDPAVWQYGRGSQQIEALGFRSPPNAPLTLSNPRHVYEIDPDGNRTTYILRVNENEHRLNGITEIIERVRGSGDANVVAREEHHYDWDGRTENTEGFDYPWDKTTVKWLSNLRRKDVKTYTYDLQGDVLTRWTKQTEYAGFGRYKIQTEYQPDSEFAPYRTTEYVYSSDETRWILGMVNGSYLHAGGVTGPVVSQTNVADRDLWGQPTEVRTYPLTGTGEYVNTVNTYNPHGMLIQTAVTSVGNADPITRVTHIVRDGAGHVLWKQFGDFTWKAFDRDVDLNTGLVTETRSPAGVATSHTYDLLGRLTKIDPGNGEYPTEISYPSIWQANVKQGGTVNYTRGRYFYDQAGRLIRQDRRNTDDSYDSQETRYDRAGRTVFVSEWTRLGMNPPWAGTTNEYWVPLVGAAGPIDPTAPYSSYVADPFGRVTRVTTAEGAVTETTYGLLQTTVTVYDVNRIPGSSTTPGGPTEAISVYTDDAFGRLVHVHVEDPNSVDAVYSYDELDNLVRVEMDAQIREFTYDGLGRLLSSQNPENGLMTFDVYDPLGRLLQKTEAKTDQGGTITKLAYDAAGRLLTETRGTTEQVLKTFAYYNDPGGSRSDLALGRLISVQTHEENDGSPAVKREFFYDGLNGRLSKEKLVFGETTTDWLETQYFYNAWGALSEIDYPLANWGGHPPTTVTYDYYNGYLIGVGDGLDDRAFVYTVTYNPAGGRQVIQYPNGTDTESIPDSRNRPANIRVRVPDPGVAQIYLPDGDEELRLTHGAPPAWMQRWIHQRPLAAPAKDSRFPEPLPTDLIAQSPIVLDPPGDGGSGGDPPPVITWESGAYQYDGAGNIIAIGTDQFAYDGQSRLTEAIITDLFDVGHSSNQVTLGYDYDGFGNMQTRTKAFPGSLFTWTFTHDGGNHIDHLSLDKQGVSEPDEETAFTYDVRGNLTEMHMASATADVLTNYVFDNQGRLREVHENGETLGRYAYDERGYRVSMVADGVETFYVRDTSGRVLSEFRRLEDNPGPPAWDKDYVYALGGAIAVIKNEVPGAPTEFIVTWAENDPNSNLMDVTLKWKRSEEGDIDYYRIYRNDTLTASVDQNTELTTMEFTETGLAADVYEYCVVAVDTAGYVSDESRHLVADCNDDDTDFDDAIWRTPEPIVSGDGQLSLYWSVDPARLDRILGFHVHRRPPGPSNPFENITPALLREPEFVDFDVANGTTYEYAITVLNTRDLERDPDLVTDTRTGTPQDETPPAPPGALRGEPGPWEDAVTLRWSPSFAEDLFAYQIFEVVPPDDVLMPVTARTGLVAGDDVCLMNFTDPAGDDVAGWNKVTPATLWNPSGGENGGPYCPGFIGWLDATGLNSEVTPEEGIPDVYGDKKDILRSTISWGSSDQTVRTFRVELQPDNVYLVEVGIGHASHPGTHTVEVNGQQPYWNAWQLGSGDWRIREDVILSGPQGFVDISIGTSDGDEVTYINYLRIRATGPDPTNTSAIIEGLSSMKKFVVKAVDDDGNLSAATEPVSVGPWSGPPWYVHAMDISDDDTHVTNDFVHKVFEWGHDRDSDNHDPVSKLYEVGIRPAPPDYQEVEYGHPLLFRAAKIHVQYPQMAWYYYSQDPENPTPDHCPEFVIHRQGESSLDWTLLTEVPLTGEPGSAAMCEVVFYDTGVTKLEHTYRMSEVSSTGYTKPTTLTYRYAHADKPHVVMGQYAFGAALVSEHSTYPSLGNIFISPEGAWELGALEPMSPIAVTWARSYHPKVIGYRIWVHDQFRPSSGWLELATIDDPETTVYFDDRAPFNWPAIPNEGSAGWQDDRCMVWPTAGGHGAPCYVGDYFAVYFVEGLTTESPAGPPLPIHEGDMWHDKVRAVRLGHGECPVREEFCVNCPCGEWCHNPEPEYDYCCEPECSWPDYWPAEDTYRNNFTSAECNYRSHEGYDNVLPTLAWPSSGGVDRNKQMGWLSTTGLWGTYNDFLGGCEKTGGESGMDERHESEVCFDNDGVNTRTFRMEVEPGTYWVEIAAGSLVAQNITTITVNGEPYWIGVNLTGVHGTEERGNIDGNGGYIDVSIGGTGTQHASCIAYVRVQRQGTTGPDGLAFLMEPESADEGGYLLARGSSTAVVRGHSTLGDPSGLAGDASLRGRAKGMSASSHVLGTLEITEIPRARLMAQASGDNPSPMPASDRLVGQIAPGSGIQWLHVDHLGSTRVVTDKNGAVVSKHKYLPFGKEFNNAGSGEFNTHKFTGHEKDEGTGVDYMLGRYHSTGIYRFLSADRGNSVTGQADPQRWNRYSYTTNRSMRYVDPDGWVERDALGPKATELVDFGATVAALELGDLYNSYVSPDEIAGKKYIFWPNSTADFYVPAGWPGFMGGWAGKTIIPLLGPHRDPLDPATLAAFIFLSAASVRDSQVGFFEASIYLLEEWLSFGLSKEDLHYIRLIILSDPVKGGWGDAFRSAEAVIEERERRRRVKASINYGVAGGGMGHVGPISGSAGSGNKYCKWKVLRTPSGRAGEGSW